MNKITLILYLSICVSSNLLAKPYIPANNETVLLTLPSFGQSSAIPKNSTIESTGSLSDYYKKVSKLLLRAKLESSERLYGEVETLINSPNITINNHSGLLLIKADIQQHFHQFDAALITLKKIPNSAQARLLEANILLTHGDYDKARRSCTALIGQSSLLLVTTCVTQTTSMRGQLKTSYQILKRTLEQYHNISDETRHWALTSLAEMAERLNENQAAISNYQQAIQLKNNDLVSRISLSDLYLQQNNLNEALLVLNGQYENDAILLRVVNILQKHAKQPENRPYQKLNTQLTHRIALLEARNDALHLDTLAEYYLNNKIKPAEALKWASAHWKNQKTPRDTRLLLRAAILANNREAIKTVQQWQQQHNLEDYWLDEQFKNASPLLIKASN